MEHETSRPIPLEVLEYLDDFAELQPAQILAHFDVLRRRARQVDAYDERQGQELAYFAQAVELFPEDTDAGQAVALYTAFASSADKGHVTFIVPYLPKLDIHDETARRNLQARTYLRLYPARGQALGRGVIELAKVIPFRRPVSGQESDPPEPPAA